MYIAYICVYLWMPVCVKEIQKTREKLHNTWMQRFRKVKKKQWRTMREGARAQVQCVENVGKLLSWSKYSYRFPKDAAHINGAKISTCSSSNRSIYLAAAADDRAMWRSSIVLPQLLATLSSAARRSECCIFIYIYTYTYAARCLSVLGGATVCVRLSASGNSKYSSITRRSAVLLCLCL